MMPYDLHSLRLFLHVVTIYTFLVLPSVATFPSVAHFVTPPPSSNLLILLLPAVVLTHRICSDKLNFVKRLDQNCN